MSSREPVTVAAAAVPSSEAEAEVGAPERPSPRPRGARDDDDAPGTSSPAAEDDTDSGDDVPDTEHVPASTAAAPASRGLKRAVAALLVLVFGLAGLTTYLFLRVDEHRAVAERDQVILTSAKQMVVNLTTMNHGSAKQDIDRLLEGSTGQFRQQFGNSAGSFPKVLQQAKVESTGAVKEAAIESSSDDKAKVLVAASATVKNKDAPNGQPRVYRMRVNLERSDEKWLVSNVEFVP